MEEKREAQRLPANAYKPLGPGETYRLYVPASSLIPEITVRSVAFGNLMTVIFTAAAAYLGLKIGQVFEDAIPIAILAAEFKLRRGDAVASAQHANFIVNAGTAKASDIMELISRVRKAVFEHTGVYLELEQIPL